MADGPLLAVEDVALAFADGRRRVQALDGVSLAVRRGEVVGVVGESGSGKSTLGRVMLRLLAPDRGRVTFDGTDARTFAGQALRRFRRRVQVVFQDNEASLDPRLTVGRTVGEGLTIHGIGAPAERRRRVDAMLTRVGLGPDFAARYPHTLSGGQRQRVNIARALVLEPELLIADEPVAALDASMQAQILALLGELGRELGLTMVFISHDLAVVRAIADRVAVMYGGRLLEVGPTERVFAAPRHPYTAMLHASIPEPDPTRTVRPPPSVPTASGVDHGGCVFAARCPLVIEACRRAPPALTPVAGDHGAACIRHPDVAHAFGR
jgi:peptide/nickel transport system ATP-binding protein